MIPDDVLVFDCVAHPFNFDPKNAIDKPGELFINHLYAFHQVLTPANEPKLPPEQFPTRMEHGRDQPNGV